eukprot:g725.t1
MEQEIVVGDGVKTNNITTNNNNQTEEAWGVGNKNSDKAAAPVGVETVHFCTCPAAVGEAQKKIRLPATKKHVYYFKRRIPGLVSDATRLQQLESLRLQKCYMETIPLFISRYPCLYQISLNDNKLISVPDELGDIKQLKFLSLAGNKLVTLPASIGKLEHLEHLNLARNQIVSLPDSLSRCSKITDLFLFDNKLESLPAPKKVNKLWPDLRLADLSKNSMVHLPAAVGAWTKLYRLNLSANLLVDLPDDFCNLQNLDTLNLADNQLKKLPENIGKLNLLTIIRLERNNLTKLPESIYDILTLRDLNLFGNPLEPLEDIPLWQYGDPSYRFKDTAKKLEEITPVPILRSEPGAKSTAGIRFMNILCDNHFSISGCRYGEYCMFSHVPPPLPTIPFQADKEKLAEETAKKKTKYYGIKHSKYFKLFQEFGKQREEAGIDHDWRDALSEEDEEDENLIQEVPSGM